MAVVKKVGLPCEKLLQINILRHLTSASRRFNRIDKPDCAHPMALCPARSLTRGDLSAFWPLKRVPDLGREFQYNVGASSRSSDPVCLAQVG